MAWEGKLRHPHWSLFLSRGGVLDALPSHIHTKNEPERLHETFRLAFVFYCIVDGREI